MAGTVRDWPGVIVPVHTTSPVEGVGRHRPSMVRWPGWRRCTSWPAPRRWRPRLVGDVGTSTLDGCGGGTVVGGTVVLDDFDLVDGRRSDWSAPPVSADRRRPGHDDHHARREPRPDGRRPGAWRRARGRSGRGCAATGRHRCSAPGRRWLRRVRPSVLWRRPTSSWPRRPVLRRGRAGVSSPTSSWVPLVPGPLARTGAGWAGPGRHPGRGRVGRTRSGVRDGATVPARLARGDVGPCRPG